MAGIPYLTEWDHKMVNFLSPIAKHGSPPKLEMLFFANTFPLAYHYAIALINEKKNPKNYILLGKWGDDEGGGKNCISYTNTPSQTQGKLGVTIFRPRYAFVSLTLASSRLRDDILSAQKEKMAKPLLISDFLKKAKDKYDFSNVSIYAEIEDLGNYLKGFVTKTFSGPDICSPGINNGVNLLEFGRIAQYPSVLRLFIYGGSLSSYLRRKKDRYLPLDIDNNSVGNEKLLKTYISCPSSFKTHLNSYHKELYKAAKETAQRKMWSEACPPFLTVYRSYNEMAWFFQHRSSFKDAQEFARCLCEHHKEFNS